jgi:predicted phage tail component-like protein
MANSLSFNGIDLSVYGLIVKTRGTPVEFTADSVLVHNISYAGDSKVPPKNISLEVAVLGSTVTELKSFMDSIMLILNQPTDEQLILDTQTDRYWLARFKTLTGGYRGLKFEGALDFTCHDPFAYAVAPSSDATAIANVVADNAVVDTGGNALIRPVYTILSDAIRVGTNVILHSDNTDEEIEWIGNLAVGTVLVFNTALWVVTKNGVEDMATVDGQFPTLVQGGINLILTAGFTGTLTVTWRDRFC